MSTFRSPDNPIITPKDIKPSRDDFEVIGAFNAGVSRLDDEVVLLLRVAERPLSTHPDLALVPMYSVTKRRIVLKEFSKDEPSNDFSDPRFVITPEQVYLTSISHLRFARSKNGIDFEIEDTPTFSAENDYETFGVEDPRISLIDGRYYITYVAVSSYGVTTCLASTSDFKSFQRHGVIFCPDNKDVVLFPEKIDGKYYVLHRPVSPLFNKQQIWIAESTELSNWGNHRFLMGPVSNSWEKIKIGASTVPFRTEEGWLEVYHGADRNNRYCLGAVLLDSQKPWKPLARTRKPIFEPETDYECSGFFGNVVFSCGLLYEENKLRVYYGAADTTICYAELPLGDVLSRLEQWDTTER